MTKRERIEGFEVTLATDAIVTGIGCIDGDRFREIRVSSAKGDFFITSHYSGRDLIIEREVEVPDPEPDNPAESVAA